jgi:hypothetical protein
MQQQPTTSRRKNTCAGPLIHRILAAPCRGRETFLAFKQCLLHYPRNFEPRRDVAIAPPGSRPSQKSSGEAGAALLKKPTRHRDHLNPSVHRRRLAHSHICRGHEQEERHGRPVDPAGSAQAASGKRHQPRSEVICSNPCRAVCSGSTGLSRST